MQSPVYSPAQLILPQDLNDLLQAVSTELNANLKRKKKKKDFGTIVNQLPHPMHLNCGQNYSQCAHPVLPCSFSQKEPWT